MVVIENETEAFYFIGNLGLINLYLPYELF
jgi:hypothetical protein